jgi:hypothetical protein
MNDDRTKSALLVLQWVIALVIVAEAADFAFSTESAHVFARTGLPGFIRLALACSEMAAAILFLVPRTIVAGGWLLIGVLVFAIVLHILHGWWNVGALVVYAVATWAVMAGRAQTSATD